MAIALLSSPTSPNGLYSPDAAALWTYVDAITINTVQNNAGDLQLDSGGIGAICSVGQYVYFAPLLAADNVDSAVVEILSVSTNYIVVDVRYSVTIAAGELRRMEAVEFKVETGYSTNVSQPRRTSQTLKVQPDIDGIYRVSAFLACKSRLKFREPILSPDSDYDHQVRAVAYPTGLTVTNSILMKATGPKANQIRPINYTNLRGLFSFIESNLFKTYIEDEKTATTLVEGDPAIISRRLTGQAVEFLFDTGLQTVAQLSWSPTKPVTILYNGSGSNTDGFYISESAPTSINGTYTIENLATGDTWQLDIELYNSIATRASCESDTFVIWWHPTGGWFTYAFPYRKVHTIEGNVATVVKGTDNERFAVAYEDIYEALTVFAEPEGEVILDALNTLHYSPQIYIGTLTGSGGATTIDLTTLQRAYVAGGGFQAKRTRPYQAMENLFGITLIKSDEIKALNQ